MLQVRKKPKSKSYQTKGFLNTGRRLSNRLSHFHSPTEMKWKIVYGAGLAQACLLLTVNPPGLSDIDSVMQRKSITRGNQIHCLPPSSLIHLI